MNKLRREGTIFEKKNFRVSRTDKINDVGLALLPLGKRLLIHVFLLTTVYWLIVLIFPYYYIESCSTGHLWTPHIVIFLFLSTSTIFEKQESEKIVEIIIPLSGHKTLSKMQKVRLIMGPMGKLDMYTDFCFVWIAFDCNSVYAPYALVLMVLASIVLAFWQVKSWYFEEVRAFELMEFITLFDLLGKCEVMYLEGEKTSAHKRNWAKFRSTLPIIKLFFEDIGQFVIELLFLIEQQSLNILVLISICLSLAFSCISVMGIYLHYKIFKPNLAKEEKIFGKLREKLINDDFEPIVELSNKPKVFRGYDEELRAEFLKDLASHSFEVFSYIAENAIMTNDNILQSDTFHERLLSSLRHCKIFPQELINSMKFLIIEKNIFINFNKKISISNEGTILHCLMEDPQFLVRSLKTKTFDLVKFLVKEGIDVNLTDKFGETAVSLAARLNIDTLIKSCSNETLLSLFSINNVDMPKIEVDCAIKDLAVDMIKFMVEKKANLVQQNRKNRNLLEIAEAAGNQKLQEFILEQHWLGASNYIIRKSGNI